MEPLQLQQLWKESYKNRELIETCTFVGCFYCQNIYLPEGIREWTDNRETALCAKCGVDSVVTNNKFKLTPAILSELHQTYFATFKKN